jgi:hypothetical protein
MGQRLLFEVDFAAMEEKVLAQMIQSRSVPKGLKYYRARISGCGKNRFMDSIGYTSKEKYASDLRSNGYKVSHIVLIESTFEMKTQTFQQGSHAFI